MSASEGDEDLDQRIRRVNRTMGRADDAEWDGSAVVDARLRVYGVGRLQVADRNVPTDVPFLAEDL